MSLSRFPVLLWEDMAGRWTACVIDDADAAGFGPTSERALRDLQEYLDWYYREDGWIPASEYDEPELFRQAVRVRPEYRDGAGDEKRVHPCGETVRLLVEGVSARMEGGVLVCALPRLGQFFYYHDEKARRDLVDHYVQDFCKGMAPSRIARLLAPKSVELAEARVRPPREGRRGWTPAESDPAALSAVAEPLGDRASRRRFSKPWEREALAEDLAKRLGSEKASVLLVGEGGVGKTSILAAAARQVEREDAERTKRETGQSRQRRLFWMTSGQRLIAGMRYLGQWEARCEEIVEEVQNLGGGGVLCVENLLEVVRAGGFGPEDGVGSFLAPYLQRGELQVVAEATPAELDACRRLLPALADCFQILRVPPFGAAEARRALERLQATLSAQRKVACAKETAATVARLHERFASGEAFPGKAAAFAGRLFERAVRDGAKEIGPADAMGLFRRETGLPELFLRDDLPLDHAEALEFFRGKVVGQEAAARAAADLAAMFKAALNDPKRPATVSLFCGPTGVGKTQMAKAIAEFFFGAGGDAKDRLLRLDMSEYGAPGSAARLARGPSGGPSDFIQKMRAQPFRVVLFDEIEKAHPEVFDMLLGLFDEGRLSDDLGRTTSFRSAIVLMTSNVGARNKASIGFGEAAPASGLAEASRFFRPEFVNRVDEVVDFRPLSEESVRVIARMELDALARREGIEKRALKLEWTPEAVELIVREGFDPRYGARPLQRAVESLAAAPLSRLLAGDPGLQGATLRMEAADGKIEPLVQGAPWRIVQPAKTTSRPESVR